MFDLSSHLWIMITAFGGAGLTLPLAITIAVWLALGYSWQRAARGSACSRLRSAWSR